MDGTKVVANASVNRSYDAEGLSGLLGRLDKAIDDLEAQNEAGGDAAVAHLPGELADKEVLREKVRQAMADLGSQKRHKRINLTDRDARLMKGRQGIVAGYNAQAMVSAMKTEEGASGMLVTAVDVVDAANDNALLAPMVEQAEETTGARAQMTLADAGYALWQSATVEVSRWWCDRFLKDPRTDSPEHSDSFGPQGQTLEFVGYSMRTESRCERASGAVNRRVPFSSLYQGQGDSVWP